MDTDILKRINSISKRVGVLERLEEPRITKYLQRYVIGASSNLIVNGFGLFADNTNFSQTVFEPTDLSVGGGSFLVDGDNRTIMSDNIIPIDPAGSYELSVWSKAKNYVSGARQYIGYAVLDVDSEHINSIHVYHTLGTETTLASDLTVGDSTISLSSAANWIDGTTSHLRHIRLYPYTNSFGYTYPDYEYSRHLATHAWNSGGISGNTITLANPWSLSNPNQVDGVWPSGTPVCNSYSSSTYSYLLVSNGIIPASWTRHSGTISGLQANGQDSGYDKMRLGTCYIRFLALCNRTVSGSSTMFNGVKLINA